MKKYLFRSGSQWLPVFCILLFTSCSVPRQISRSAKKTIENPSLANAHVGISIYEPATGKYWFNYQGDKYFTPASNTKLATCYVALKYLGDSLTGILKAENDTAIYLIPTGDPTFLHPDFKDHPVFDLLRNSNKKIYISDGNWQSEAWGMGWSWDDYNEDYQPERSPLPVYGNVLKWIQDNQNARETAVVYSLPEVNWEVDFNSANAKNFSVQRDFCANVFHITQGKEKYKEIEVPFITHGLKTSLELLPDTLHKTIEWISPQKFQQLTGQLNLKFSPVKSQAVDTFMRLGMHRSDNFYLEQSLMMVSQHLLGVMNEKQILDTLLKTDYKDLPQKPKWVGGSGLSHYNLFSPKDFISILNKMKNDFGLDRMKNILATGNTGTLTNYYKADSGYIYAKTGTLSGVVSLSGYLLTRKNKQLIFSVLVNNHHSSAATIRRTVEKFIEGLRNKF
ncbi:MAG: D-alanyl-D-alanine carboxypeptidase [Chitinophagales bacterium]|nr:D-alanyl-D-alanine carboxypeptidase [Chitinophagales bacterium]